MREGRMFFGSFIWQELIFLQYFPLVSFPITQCFPFIISPLGSLSPIPLLKGYEAFLPQKPGNKIVRLLLSSSLCVTLSSNFLSSQIITLLGFLRILSHENAVADCHHLATPNLYCLIKLLSFFAHSSHVSSAAFLEK